MSGHVDYIGLGAAVVGDEAESCEIVDSVEHAALVVDIVLAEVVEGSLIHLAGLHVLAGLNDSIGGLVEEEFHILRVGAGGILALTAIGDADVFRKLDEEGIPETLRVDAAVAMGRKDIDRDYVFVFELFCNAVADLLDVLARDADALDGRENDLAASVVNNNSANLHVIEHGLNSVRREVLKQVARKIIMSVENIVGDEARLAVAELPLRVLRSLADKFLAALVEVLALGLIVLKLGKSPRQRDHVRNEADYLCEDAVEIGHENTCLLFIRLHLCKSRNESPRGAHIVLLAAYQNLERFDFCQILDRAGSVLGNGRIEVLYRIRDILVVVLIGFLGDFNADFHKSRDNLRNFRDRDVSRCGIRARCACSGGERARHNHRQCQNDCENRFECFFHRLFLLYLYFFRLYITGADSTPTLRRTYS